AGEAAESTALGEDAVAGDDDAVGIVARGGARGAGGLGLAGAAGELGGGDRFAGRDARGLLPRRPLGVSALGVEWECGGLALAGEVFLHLLDGELEDGMLRVMFPAGLRAEGVPAADEVDADEVRVVGDEEEVADRGVLEDGVGFHGWRLFQRWKTA